MPSGMQGTAEFTTYFSIVIRVCHVSPYTILRSMDGACPVSSPFYARNHICYLPETLPPIQNSLARLPAYLNEKQGL